MAVAADERRTANVERSSHPLRRSPSVGLLLEAALLAGLVLLALQLRLANLGHYSGSFDEGIRMQQLLLMEHGYRPFRDIFASQGPLLLDLLYPFYVALGRNLEAARLGVSLLSLAGMIGAWWVLRRLRTGAGLGAAVLLALSPTYLDNSRLALAEIPSVAPCIWAVGCAIRWQRGGSAGWLFGAAVLASLGILIKPMALPVLAPLAVLVLLRRPVEPRAVILAAVLGGGLAVVALIALDPTRVYEVLGQYRGGAQRPAGSAALENATLVAKVLGAERLGFLALAGVGLLLGFLTWPRVALALAAWPLAQLAIFLLYTDLADKHVAYFVPQLALLGGLVFGFPALSLYRLRRAGHDQRSPRSARDPLWNSAWPRLRHRLPRSRAPALPLFLALAVVAGYAFSVPSLWRADRELLRDADDRTRRDYAGTREQAALMAAITAPSDFVLTDHPLAAFEARRLVPPWLVDTSGTRIDARSLTDEVAIREASRYQPKVVVTWRRRLGKLDGFTRWLANDYRLVKTYPGSDPSNPLQVYVHAELEPSARAFLAGR